MKKIFRLFMTAVVLVAMLIAFFAVKNHYSNTDRDDDSPINFTVGQGETVAEIASNLKKQGIIEFEKLFVLRMKFSGKADKINYGTYVIKKGTTMGGIIDILTSGDASAGVTVTIPEGYSAEMIAKRLEENGICPADAFLGELNKTDYDYDFIKQLPTDSNEKYILQGYLFPDTYTFNVGEDPHNIVSRMLAEFENKLDGLGGYTSEYSLNELITIASLIEREAQLSSERATISGVLYNRLKDNMILQIDATVMYVVSDGLYNIGQVTYNDLKVDSPYNTYRHRGLPAGAICSPGLESIKAAINPQSHNYVYYHTDEGKNDGSHIFTETYEQHTDTMSYQ